MPRQLRSFIDKTLISVPFTVSLFLQREQLMCKCLSFLCHFKETMFFNRGGIVITVTGENLDSVEEPVMVVTVMSDDVVNVYYQVKS